jgi:small subunit ribosomal protein S1
MSREILKSNQFAQAHIVASDDLQLSEAQKQELALFYETGVQEFKAGQLVVGKVVEQKSNSLIVDISYKSNGLIPLYEFSKPELEAFVPNSDIEVIIEELEDFNGNIVLSYENAKAVRAWARIMDLHEKNEPVEGLVTHKVKGGLSVDIGIPAFLPGSQVDLHRVTNFDQYVGQKITADVIKVNKKRGNVIISRRKHLSSQRDGSRKLVLETLEADQVITGVVKNITNYGVFIDVGGVDGLLHITDMTWGRISHPGEMVNLGEEIKVRVLSIDKVNNKISLGLKQLEGNPWKDIEGKIQVGSVVKGKVASVADYGLFVEIDRGVEGLIHISEISWTERITNLSERFAVGSEVEALVVSMDTNNRRMSLSIKQMEKNPWTTIQERFEVGQKITGKISNITDFGIFVQLVPGIDGLIHVSDLSWVAHIDNLSSEYTKGAEIEALILSIDKDSKKIALGVKQLASNPWDTLETEHPVDSQVEGLVTKIMSYGAFVRLPNGIEGLLYSSEMQGEQEKAVEEGKTYAFRISNINKEEHKVGLSLNLEKKPVAPKRKPVAPRKAESFSKADYEKYSAPQSLEKTSLQLQLEKHAAKQKKNKKDAALAELEDSDE